MMCGGEMTRLALPIIAETGGAFDEADLESGDAESADGPRGSRDPSLSTP